MSCVGDAIAVGRSAHGDFSATSVLAAAQGILVSGKGRGDCLFEGRRRLCRVEWRCRCLYLMAEDATVDGRPAPRWCLTICLSYDGPYDRGVRGISEFYRTDDHRRPSERE